ncbi:MAG TPA: VWA domain-containing protein [Vicinamibacterales bacterium]|nr:VWA domain-containing protein [Vicinamibacterales bacterium]
MPVRTFRRRCLIACWLAAAAAGAAARQPAQPSVPLFRAGADLVLVDAVVLDKSGRPVLDLRADDFELKEDGKPQPVQQVYLVRGRASATEPAAPPSGDPSIAIRPAPPRIFIVVFDGQHLSPGGFKRVQAAATTLFQKEFHDGDVGGVVIDGEMANKRLTGDREELIAAVRQARPSSAVASRLFDLREWPSMNDAEAFEIVRKGPSNNDVFNEVMRRACTDDPDACKRVPPDAAVLEKAQRMTAAIRASSDQTLRMLGALLGGLERISGRKTILLLSEGFIADGSWPVVQLAVGAAARANARIYSLDARGLDKGRQPIGNYAPHDDTLGNLLASFDIGADSINSLAVDTGGFVVRNTNIFDQVIGEIAAEAGTYYVLAYRPAAADNAFHRISVVCRRPGATVRARRGYIATPRALPTIAEAAQAQRDAAGPKPAPTVAAAGAGALPAPLAAEPTAPASSPILPPEPRKNAVANFEALAARDAAAPASSGAVSATPAREAQADAAAGWEAYRRGDLESARTALTTAAAAPSARPWVHYALGQTDYALRDFGAAVEAWETVRRAVPEFEPVYFDLVDGYLQSRDPDRAVHVLRAAADRWPGDREVFNALGVVQVSRGSLDDAVKSFEQAIALAPNETTSYFNLAKTLELRYVRTRRYVSQTRTWVANENDRANAIANYQKYLDMGGGPFSNSARDGLTRLNWK